MDRKAIVMGASSGLGREIALALLKNGWKVGVAARREEALQAISVENGHRPIVMQIDITEGNAGEKLHELINRLGGVDLYFHASGIGKQNPFLDEKIELNTVKTNGIGFTAMVGTVFRWMAEHGGGHIAVISSIAGTKGLGPAPSYSATKAFQSTYIQSLEQLSNSRRLQISFTDFRPGFVDTDLIKGSNFPLTMSVSEVAEEMMWAIENKRHVRIIDWRWRLIVSAWKCIPNFIWRKMKL